MTCPCKDCLILPICKNKVMRSGSKIYTVLYLTCHLLYEYIDIQINLLGPGEALSPVIGEDTKKELEEIFGNGAVWWDYPV